MSLNHIVIQGRLTGEPELRTTQSGVSVASFTVAVDRDFGGRDGSGKETDFISVVAWRQTGEFVSKYFHKGSMIVVSGRLQSRKWEANDGSKRVAWEVNADNCYFGGDKKADSGENSDFYRAGSGVTVSGATFEELGDDDGEMPF